MVAGGQQHLEAKICQYLTAGGVILCVPAEISQILNSPGLDGIANLFLYLLYDKRKIIIVSELDQMD